MRVPARDPEKASELKQGGAEIVAGDLGDPSYVPVPHEAAKDSMLGMGFTEWVADGFIELDVGFKDGYADETTDGVETLAGHPPGELERFSNDFNQASE